MCSRVPKSLSWNTWPFRTCQSVPMIFITCNLTLTISFWCVLILSWTTASLNALLCGIIKRPVLYSHCQTLPIYTWHSCVILMHPRIHPAAHLYTWYSHTCKFLLKSPSQVLIFVLVIFKLRKLVSHKVVFTHPFLRKWPVGIGIPTKHMSIFYDWRVLEENSQIRDQIFKEHNTS